MHNRRERHLIHANAVLVRADFTESDLEGVVLKDVKGIEAAKGMDKAANRDKVVD